MNGTLPKICHGTPFVQSVQGRTMDLNLMVTWSKPLLTVHYLRLVPQMMFGTDRQSLHSCISTWLLPPITTGEFSYSPRNLLYSNTYAQAINQLHCKIQSPSWSWTWIICFILVLRCNYTIANSQKTDSPFFTRSFASTH